MVHNAFRIEISSHETNFQNLFSVEMSITVPMRQFMHSKLNVRYDDFIAPLSNHQTFYTLL